MTAATVCYRADIVSQCGSCIMAKIEIDRTRRFARNPKSPVLRHCQEGNSAAPMHDLHRSRAATSDQMQCRYPHSRQQHHEEHGA